MKLLSLSLLLPPPTLPPFLPCPLLSPPTFPPPNTFCPSLSPPFPYFPSLLSPSFIPYFPSLVFSLHLHFLLPSSLLFPTLDHKGDRRLYFPELTCLVMERQCQTGTLDAPWDEIQGPWSLCIQEQCSTSSSRRCHGETHSERMIPKRRRKRFMSENTIMLF